MMMISILLTEEGPGHSVVEDHCRVLPPSIQYWLPLDPRGSNGPCEVNTSIDRLGIQWLEIKDVLVAMMDILESIHRVPWTWIVSAERYCSLMPVGPG